MQQQLLCNLQCETMPGCPMLKLMLFLRIITELIESIKTTSMDMIWLHLRYDIIMWDMINFMAYAYVWNIGANTVSMLYTLHGSPCHGADSRLAPSQWETALLCNDVSHWLGANLDSALMSIRRGQPGHRRDSWHVDMHAVIGCTERIWHH